MLAKRLATLAPSATLPGKPPIRRGSLEAGVATKKLGCAPLNSSTMARSAGAVTSARQRRPPAVNSSPFKWSLPQ